MIFKIALGKEKDSIVFFSLRVYVPTEIGKIKIDDIIKEDMRHIAIPTGRSKN